MMVATQIPKRFNDIFINPTGVFQLNPSLLAAPLFAWVTQKSWQLCSPHDAHILQTPQRDKFQESWFLLLSLRVNSVSVKQLLFESEIPADYQREAGWCSASIPKIDQTLPQVSRRLHSPGSLRFNVKSRCVRWAHESPTCHLRQICTMCAQLDVKNGGRHLVQSSIHEKTYCRYSVNTNSDVADHQ